MDTRLSARCFSCSELGSLCLELSSEVRVPLVLALLKINSETQWVLVVDEEGDSRAQEPGNPERIKMRDYKINSHILINKKSFSLRKTGIA